jgi:glycosyltransferase involved in cell wall biosynthesis
LKISVITATFNSAKFINCCLSSVQNQTYKNIDHIVIDGASTDETLSILESNRDQLKIIISEPDKGVYDAMNKGIMISEGDIIGFLNSDDFYANNEVLSKVAKLFSKNPSLDGCYSDLIYTNQFNTKKNVRYWKSSKFVPGLFSKGWCPPHLTFFVRRAVYEKFSKFNLNYNIASDVELMMRFLEVHKINVQYIPEVWVKMRMGGLSNKNFLSIIKQNREILHALKKHKLLNNFFIFLIYKIISRMKQFINSK